MSEIIIGQHVAFDLIKEHTATYQKIFVITDHNLASLYRLDHNIISITPGEQSKNLSNAESIINQILAQKPDVDSLIIGFGGGVVCDIAGFVASILLRGVDLILVPTSLIAQVDAAIGGKNAVNSPYGKNLIGSFYLPKVVIIDTDILNSLPDREYNSGFAEIIKHAFIKGDDELLFIEQCAAQLKKRDANVVYAMVKRSANIKQELVDQDFLEEKSIRTLLNFGHSFGHALEACYDYNSDVITHGEAVAWGMMLEYEFAMKLGYVVNIDGYSRLSNLLQTFDLLVFNPHMNVDEVFKYVKSDKKNKDDIISLVLPTDDRGLEVVSLKDNQLLYNFLISKAEENAYESARVIC